MRHNRIWLLTVSGICFSAALLPARIFWEGGGDLFTPASFGREIYKAVMEINGGKADVCVVACENGLASVQASLATNRDPTAAWFSGDSLGLGRVSRDGKTLRLATLSFGPGRPDLMVTVIQSTSEAIASRPEYARHRLSDIPVPPGAAVLGTMNNTDTRTTVERLVSRMSMETVARFYENAMARNGWIKMVKSVENTGLLCYIKGADVCCVMVAAQDSNGETGITLLHKQGAVN